VGDVSDDFETVRELLNTQGPRGTGKRYVEALDRIEARIREAERHGTWRAAYEDEHNKRLSAEARLREAESKLGHRCPAPGLQARIAELEQELPARVSDAYAGRAYAAEARIAELEEKLNDELVAAEQHFAERKELEQELETFKSSHAATVAALEKEEDRGAELEQENERLRAADIMVECEPHTRARVEELERQLSEAEAENERLRETNRDLQEKYDNWESDDLDVFRAENERLRAERETLLDQDRTNELQAEVDRLREELLELRAGHPAGVRREALIRELETEVERLQKALEEIGNDADAAAPLAVKAREALKG
jgi:chromosome segregation ATPase